MNRRTDVKRRRGAVAWMGGALVLLAAPVVQAQHWGREEFPRTGACFFQDPNFKGDYFCVNAGRDYSSLPSGMNDKISSIQVFGGAEVTVFQDARFEGRSTRFRGDVRNLKDEGWNDLLSSLRVSSRGGSSGHGGSGHGSSRYSSADADRIVRRAYEDILDRQPDTAGLRLYRSRIIDDGWSEQQVREALRKSPEYKEKSTMTRQKAEEIVRRAYLSELQREPDAGSRAYVDRVLRDHWTEQDVARELRKSAEYRDKHR
jgi:Peptidase inhibitor family I36